MSRTSLSIYRLPIAPGARVGSVRVVIDRNQKVYVNGSKVVAAVTSGDFLILTLANDSKYYVKSSEYERLTKGGQSSR